MVPRGERQRFSVCEESGRRLNWSCVEHAELSQRAGALPPCLLAPAVFLDLFSKAAGLSCSSKLGKYSVPKGDGGCAVRISVVFFWTLWCLRRQGAENKGWNWTTCDREPREAPSFLPSNQRSLFCLAASLQLPHELCPCPLLPYSPSSPSQGLSSPSPPCNTFGCCKPGRGDAQLFSSSWAMSSSFLGFPSAGLPFSGAPGDSHFSVQINAHPTLGSLSLRAWEINIEEHSGAEIAPIRLKAPVSLDVYPRSYGGIAKSPPCFCFPFLHSLLFLPYPIWYLSDTVLLPPELLIRKR